MRPGVEYNGSVLESVGETQLALLVLFKFSDKLGTGVLLERLRVSPPPVELDVDETMLVTNALHTASDKWHNKPTLRGRALIMLHEYQTKEPEEENSD